VPAPTATAEAASAAVSIRPLDPSTVSRLDSTFFGEGGREISASRGGENVLGADDTGETATGGMDVTGGIE